MSDEYITRYDAEMAIAEIYSPYGEDGSGDTISREVAMSEIREIPTADVAPVVRCKDCLRWERDSHGGVCDRYGVRTTNSWFCAGGEKTGGAT